MPEYTFTLPPQEVPLKRISNLLCCAFKGNVSTAWCSVAKSIPPTTWEFTSNPDAHYLHDYPLNPSGMVFLETPPEDGYGIVCLAAQAIENGLKAFAEKYPHHLADFLAENEDAKTGDAFLQCCCFGEMIYS